MRPSHPIILETPPSKDYALLDSGDGEKFERYGRFTLVRPDPQALWPKHSPDQWQRADGVFSRSEKSEWKFKPGVPEHWEIELSGLRFKIRPSAFKHTGLFPEQAPNWTWMQEKIQNARRPISVLNLFAYTGAATLACAKAGASVCHVDASKVAIDWAKDHAAINHLSEKPIRWIFDDATKFLTREVKRKKSYDAILLDPPAFGHGPHRELWKIEQHFLPLLRLCKQLLSPSPLFLLLNGYAAGYSSLAYANNLQWMTDASSGTTEFGELTLRGELGDRLLPCGIFARWSSG